jgi:YbbR domain-containing protein
MIPLPELLRQNLGWKILSLALAIAFWATIKTVSTERGDQVERLYINLPVRIVSSTTDVRTFKVTPDQVAVTVKGRGDVMKALTDRELHIFADITGADTSATRHFTRRVQVAIPVGVTIVRVDPTEVVVDVPASPSESAPTSNP